MNQIYTPTALIALIFSVLIVPMQDGEATPEDSAREFEKALRQAQRGDAAAQVRVGIAYDSGRGVGKDSEQALAWYRKAAAQGDGSGMLQLGYKYEAGEAVKKDLGMAAEWFKKALDTKSASIAGSNLVRLSKAGLIEDTYVGIPIEGGFLTTHVDLTVPLDSALDQLAANPKTVMTGKAYWIGYNPQMLCVGARGENALPALVEFVKNVQDPEIRTAGLLSIHLIGLECEIAGRTQEDFRNRKAREALWELMKVEGLTDEVSWLLKRDPWPADVPMIMDALEAVKGNCPATLNTLIRYPLEKRTVDPPTVPYGGRAVRFTIPVSYTGRSYVELAIDGLRKSWGEENVVVEDGMLEEIIITGTSGIRNPKPWEGTVTELLQEVKDIHPRSSFTDTSRHVFYFIEQQGRHEKPLICFCSALTAKKRWLEWWDQSGKDWYSASP